MDESESKNEKPQKKRRLDPELLKKGLRCDLDQYEMLKRCSDKKDMTEWNEWRKNKDEVILLEGADFNWFYLKEILLSTDTTLCVHGKVYLKKAIFLGTRLENADLRFAHLECANFNGAHLEETDLSGAHLQGAYFMDAHLESSKLNMSNMVNTMLRSANMNGATLNNANLQGAEFLLVIVDGSTLLWHCKVSRYSKNVNFTDFRGVSLDSVRIDPGTKQLLEYNIRRMNWEKWYPKQHWSLRWLVRKFWEISDYGLSTGRIIVTFFALAFVFANIYYHWGRIAPPGFVSYLFVDKSGVAVSWWLVPLRTLYFSIVTMTTLGFGDMYANAQSICGHILLSVQVILGYVLLGALITRFAVLFTAGGPAGKFADEKEKETKESKSE